MPDNLKHKSDMDQVFCTQMELEEAKKNEFNPAEWDMFSKEPFSIDDACGQTLLSPTHLQGGFPGNFDCFMESSDLMERLSIQTNDAKNECIKFNTPNPPAFMCTS